MNDIEKMTKFLAYVIKETDTEEVAFIIVDVMVSGYVFKYSQLKAAEALEEGIKDTYGLLQAIANGNPNLKDQLTKTVLDIVQTWYEDFLETLKEE